MMSEPAGPTAARPSAGFPGFDRPVAPGGYLWWYVDALSDDGLHGLTLIAMLGSVFSPYYARARRRGAADPLDHCALNVALYGAGGKRWSATERGHGVLAREAIALKIGPSMLHWNGECLVIHIDEWTVPLPSRLRGVVRVYPGRLNAESFALDARGRHLWTPLAACARVEVDMQSPARCWRGQAYLDSNAGEEPLEAGFHSWDWSRARLANGDTLVLYDVRRREGPPLALALRVRPDGTVVEFSPPPTAPLATAAVWRMPRATRSEPGYPARVLQTLEDTPFYARSLLSTRLEAEAVTAVHESLSLERFDTRWVQALLPFRMPRRRGRREP